MDKIKVLVIDKQTYYRAGVCQALSGQDDLELSDCDPGDNPIGLIETSAHDVVLLDIDLPPFSGLTLGREIARRCPATKVIMLTPAKPNDEELFEVVKVGAVAYLSKNTTPEDLAQTIKRVGVGKVAVKTEWMLLRIPAKVGCLPHQHQNQGRVLGKSGPGVAKACSLNSSSVAAPTESWVSTLPPR
ncbi:unnamed protein product [marine sediment metagenome]|uniref:Response regulatory domain-containing protein n=1 Tax=marine sediment metagenome TaxID=412755 RepID=X1J895_9ZZZZ